MTGYSHHGPHHENVLKLNLMAHHLQGTIPPELHAMSHLVSIDLSHNKHLSGNVPKEIGNLEKLDSLLLFRTALSGTVPDEVCDLADDKMTQIFTDCNHKIVCECCQKCY